MNRERIIKDLLGLPDIIASIESDFANVAAEMTRLDQRKILPVKFAPEWKAIHDKYTHLMLNSKVEANEICNKISELTEVKIPMLELPIKQISVEAKKGALTKYIQSLELFKSSAVENCQKFLRLKQDVVAFRDTINTTFDNEKALVEKGFEATEKRILELEEALGNISSIFQKTWDTLKTMFTREDTSAANTPPRITYQDIMGVVIGFLTSDLTALLKLHPKGGDVPQKELSILQSEGEKRDEAREEYAGAGKGLRRLDPIFVQMANNICAIQLIWHLLLQDCQSLLSKLSNLNTTEPEATAGITASEHETELNLYVQSVKAAYTILKHNLEGYALAGLAG